MDSKWNKMIDIKLCARRISIAFETEIIIYPDPHPHRLDAMAAVLGIRESAIWMANIRQLSGADQKKFLVMSPIWDQFSSLFLMTNVE